jgi:hypothetical protein
VTQVDSPAGVFLYEGFNKMLSGVSTCRQVKPLLSRRSSWLSE